MAQFFEPPLNPSASQTLSRQIFLRVALDLRRAVLPFVDLVPSNSKMVLHLALVDRLNELLGSEKFTGLDRPRLIRHR